MKDLELRLISELMKNSRRSDRELAKVLSTSQPTVSRLIKKLEEQGYIKEYTMIPDFGKLGFELMAVTTYKLKAVSDEKLEELHKAAREMDKQERRPYLLVMDGFGLGKDLIVISFHKTYSEYASYMRSVKEAAGSGMKAYMNLADTESFLIDWKYKNHYQPLTFSRIATHLQTMENERKE